MHYPRDFSIARNADLPDALWLIDEEWQSEMPVLQRARDGSRFVETAEVATGPVEWVVDHPRWLGEARHVPRRPPDTRKPWWMPELQDAQDWRKAWQTPECAELPNAGEWARRVIAAVDYPDVQITILPASAYQMRVDILWPARGVKTWGNYGAALAPEAVAQEIRDYIDRRRGHDA